MAIEQITTKPWEADDPERVAKFKKGIPGETADIWIAKPNLEACWRGDYRSWNIEDGKHYQEQLWCGFHEKFINPSGHSCELCKRHRIFNWQSSHLREALTGLIAAKGRDYVGAIIVRAVEDAKLSEKKALELVDEFDLETANP